ncbi:hypothetical protein DEO72_LG5g2926 [Vigna unguiculata]|uniref:Uncharacterized protein n=1 Tax=Vigna unguiculata TaxID=3917 RepID=A0A4D6M1S3_VIGUN|nr:hypothetical protein DEO72_LG5g2926 [Vigna unguiculata]
MNQNVERLLNFCPVEQRYDKICSNVAPEADNIVPLIPALKTEQGHKNMEALPGTVIIVNTQNVDKEMIMSRRSSYQVILAMEKEGIQVVERDLNLPADIILSSAICLAWYDSENLGKKATPTTEASSSLPLYRCCLYQVQNERKRKHSVSSHQMDELCFDELTQFETINPVVEAVPDSSTLPKPFDFGISKNTGKSSEFAKTSLSMSEFFGQKQSTSAATMRNHSGVSYSPGNCKAPPKLEQLRQPGLSLKNKELAQNEILDTDLMGKSLNWHSLSNSEKLHEDVRGEVVDLTDNPLFDKSFDIPDSMYFTNLITETEKDPMRKNKIARTLSFDNCCHPETNSSKIWRSLKDTGEVDEFREPDFGENVFPLDFKSHGNIGLTQASVRNLEESPFKEELSHLSETPLSFARRSSFLLKNSPWTTEFINKVKEKSKLRQKSLSSESSGPYFGYPGNMSKAFKRRSPSVIDLFKYQPGKISGNVPEQKRQKQLGLSSNSTKKGRYSTSSSSWTPKDKRSTKVRIYSTFMFIKVKIRQKEEG